VRDTLGSDRPSYWQITYTEAPRYAPLEDSLTVEVAVVGAGFTAVATAYYLRQLGIRVALVEKDRVGWGASGRNGGQLLTGWPSDMVDLRTRWGDETARALWDMALDAVHRVVSLVEREGIDAGLDQVGHLEACWSRDDVARLRREWDWLQEQAAYAPVEWWDARMVEERIRTNAYPGGLFDPGSYQIQPYRYVTGLAQAAARQGVLIFERSPVIDIRRRPSGYDVRTPQGVLKADEVVVATNAYRLPGSRWLESHILPVTSAVLVTDPLPADWPPSMPTVSDNKPNLSYFRLTPDRRLVFGGRARPTDRPGTPADPLYRDMVQLFPDLSGIGVDHRWEGPIAISWDRVPRMGRTPAGFWFAGGFTGHGVALTTEFGWVLAHRVAGQDDRLPPFWPKTAAALDISRLPRLPFGRWTQHLIRFLMR